MTPPQVLDKIKKDFRESWLGSQASQPEPEPDVLRENIRAKLQEMGYEGEALEQAALELEVEYRVPTDIESFITDETRKEADDIFGAMDMGQRYRMASIERPSRGEFRGAGFDVHRGTLRSALHAQAKKWASEREIAALREQASWGDVITTKGTAIPRGVMGTLASAQNMLDRVGEYLVKQTGQEIDPTIPRDKSELQRLADYLNEQADPSVREDWTTKVLEGLGGTAPIAAAGFMGPLAVMGAGSTVMMDDLYNRHIEAGANHDEAMSMSMLGIPLGATEIVPMGRLWKMLGGAGTFTGRMVSKLMQNRPAVWTANVATQAVTEALTELGQEIGANAVLKYGFKPDEPLIPENVEDIVTVSAAIGTLFGGYGATVNELYHSIRALQSSNNDTPADQAKQAVADIEARGPDRGTQEGLQEMQAATPVSIGNVIDQAESEYMSQLEQPQQTETDEGVAAPGEPDAVEVEAEIAEPWEYAPRDPRRIAEGHVAQAIRGENPYPDFEDMTEMALDPGKMPFYGEEPDARERLDVIQETFGASAEQAGKMGKMTWADVPHGPIRLNHLLGLTEVPLGQLSAQQRGYLHHLLYPEARSSDLSMEVRMMWGEYGGMRSQMEEDVGALSQQVVTDAPPTSYEYAQASLDASEYEIILKNIEAHHKRVVEDLKSLSMNFPDDSWEFEDMEWRVDETNPATLVNTKLDLEIEQNRQNAFWLSHFFRRKEQEAKRRAAYRRGLKPPEPGAPAPEEPLEDMGYEEFWGESKDPGPPDPDTAWDSDEDGPAPLGLMFAFEPTFLANWAAETGRKFSTAAVRYLRRGGFLGPQVAEAFLKRDRVVAEKVNRVLAGLRDLKVAIYNDFIKGNKKISAWRRFMAKIVPARNYDEALKRIFDKSLLGDDQARSFSEWVDLFMKDPEIRKAIFPPEVRLSPELRQEMRQKGLIDEFPEPQEGAFNWALTADGRLVNAALEGDTRDLHRIPEMTADAIQKLRYLQDELQTALGPNLTGPLKAAIMRPGREPGGPGLGTYVTRRYAAFEHPTRYAGPIGKLWHRIFGAKPWPERIMDEKNVWRWNEMMKEFEIENKQELERMRRSLLASAKTEKEAADAVENYKRSVLKGILVDAYDKANQIQWFEKDYQELEAGRGWDMGGEFGSQLTSYKMRKQLTETFRNFLGEDKRGFANTLATVENIAQLVAGDRLRREIPRLMWQLDLASNTRDESKGHVHKLVDDDNWETYPSLRLYTTQDVKRDFNDMYDGLAKNRNLFTRTLADISGMAKLSSTMYNWTSLLRNPWSRIPNSVVQGSFFNNRVRKLMWKWNRLLFMNKFGRRKFAERKGDWNRENLPKIVLQSLDSGAYTRSRYLGSPMLQRMEAKPWTDEQIATLSNQDVFDEWAAQLTRRGILGTGAGGDIADIKQVAQEMAVSDLGGQEKDWQRMGLMGQRAISNTFAGAWQWGDDFARGAAFEHEMDLQDRDFGDEKSLDKKLEHAAAEVTGDAGDPAYIAKWFKERGIDTQDLSGAEDLNPLTLMQSLWDTAQLMASNTISSQRAGDYGGRVLEQDPTYTNLNRWVDFMKRNPAFASFPSWAAAMRRVFMGHTFRIMRESLDPDPRIRKRGKMRAVRLVAASGWTHTLELASRLMSGVSREEEEADRSQAPDYDKWSTWLYAGRDKDGNVIRYDISWLDPFDEVLGRVLSAFEGQRGYGNKILEMLQEYMSPYIEYDIGFKALVEAAFNQRRASSLFDERWRSPPLYSEQEHPKTDPQAWIIRAGHVLGAAVWPRSLDMFINMYRAAVGDYKPLGEQYDVTSQAVRFMGFRRQVVDRRVRFGVWAGNQLRSLNESEWIVENPMKERRVVPLEELAEKHAAMEKRRQLLWRQFRDHIRLLQAAGVPRRDIARILRSINMSREMERSLYTGRYRPWRPKPMQRKRIIDRLHAMQQFDRDQEIRERYNFLLDLSRKTRLTEP